MKKQKIIILSFILGATALFPMSAIADNLEKKSEIDKAVENVNKTEWLRLGVVTPLNKERYIKGDLYLYKKPIQGYNMFRFVRYGEEYPVIRNGAYIEELDRQPNAKVTVGGETFYFDVPIEFWGFKVEEPK